MYELKAPYLAFLRADSVSVTTTRKSDVRGGKVAGANSVVRLLQRVKEREKGWLQVVRRERKSDLVKRLRPDSNGQHSNEIRPQDGIKYTSFCFPLSLGFRHR